MNGVGSGGRDRQRDTARLRALRLSRGLRAAGEEVYAWDPASGRFSAASRLRELIGRQEPIEHIEAWRAHMHPDDRDAHARWSVAIRELEEGSSDLEYRVRHSDGRWVWVWERAMLVRGPRGGRLRVVSNIADISARKTVEERLQTALDAARIGLWSAEDGGTELHLSPRARAILDLGADEATKPEALYARTLQPDRYALLRAWARMRLRQLDPPQPLLFRVRAQDGRVRWIESAMRAVPASSRSTQNRQSLTVAIVGTASDVTARQAAENELRDSAQRFRQLVENLGDVYWIVDWRNHRQAYVSPACERLWGITPQELYAGSPHWSEHIHLEDLEAVQTSFNAIADCGEFEAEYRMLRRDGKVCWVRDRAVAVRDADGAVERVIGVAEDITERRSQAGQAAERERRLDLALGASGLHVWTFDVGDHRLTVADALCKVLGLDPRHCARPGGWRRRIAAEDRAAVEAAFRECLAEGRDIDIEFRVLTQGAGPHWVAVRATLIRDAGRPHLYGVCADISARRAGEQRVRDSEQQLRTITEAIPVGIARLSRERRYRFMNRSYAKLLGIVPDDSAARSSTELLGPQVATAVDPLIAAVLGGTPVRRIMTLDFPVGMRTVDISLIPDPDASGAIAGWIEVINDLTEQRRIEGRLYQRDREFQTLVENAPDVIARLDRELRYLYVNQAAEKVFGSHASAFVGKSAEEIGLPIGMRLSSEAAAAAAFESGMEGSTTFEIAASTSHAGLRHMSARFVPEFDRTGNIVESVLMIVYDVTDRVHALRDREDLHAAERAARERAESAARARDQFLAIVSHELRSPLNGIQSWSSVLESQMPTDVPAVMWRALTGIKTGVDQQVRLIEDLLDATRILSGTLSLTMAPVELRPIVEAAVASVNTAAATKGIEVLSLLQLDDEQIRGDPDRVQQIVWNLLSNAVKFTPAQGSVRVLLDRVEDHARLRVTDNGKGIEADFLPHMFEWFRRDETSSQRRQDGLGLGLALVRHLVELHRGRIRAQSEGPGHGATFEVLLPLQLLPRAMAAPPPAQRSAAHPVPTLRGLHIMVIDDQAEARESLSVLLESMDASVHSFASGAQGLAWLEQHRTLHPVDVLLCDLAMPDEDGYETLRRLRAYETSKGIPKAQELKAIALTAYAQGEERRRALSAGFLLHVSKPASAYELAVAIHAVVEQTQRA